MNAKTMSRLTIVMYHYVRELKNSRFPDIKGLELSLFIEQIEYLRKNYQIVTAEEVINSIDNGDVLPPKAALLTFDDAYIDHYLYVFPILDKYKLQGSFYTPVMTVTENKVLDVNKIHYILASTDEKNEIIKDIQTLLSQYQSEYGLKSFDFYFKKLARNGRFDSKEIIFIKRLLQSELDEELRGRIADELFVKYVGINESTLSQELYMNREQIITMRKHGMHIGCHGSNHYWWTRLSAQELEREVDLSLKFLADIGVDMNNWTACYPNGLYDSQSARILSEKGCKFAMTIEADIANTNKDSRFIMPRLDTNYIPKERFANVNDWYLKH